MKKSAEPENFSSRSPYREAFDIGYPQENVEGELHVYRCAHCKVLTTDINGRLENHAQGCAYRALRMEERSRKP